MLRRFMIGAALLTLCAQPAFAEQGDWLVRARHIR